MKRLRCPKCDESILFDSSAYDPGRVLVFECPACHKQFKIRIPSREIPAEEMAEEEAEGWLVVLENAFHLKQEIPLRLGENVIGRHVRGTKADAAIKTVDPSVDTTHCIITVKRNERTGSRRFSLRDAPSTTGTFLGNTLLKRGENAYLSDGDIVTIGATTMILRENNEQEEKK